jgi:hypothetical protein
MPVYNVDILRSNREGILKAELGAFLHNIGKFGREFVESKLPGGPAFGYEYVAGVLNEILQSRGKALPPSAQQSIKQRLDSGNRTLADAFLPADGIFAQRLRSTSITLPHPFDDRTYRVGDLIEFQNPVWYRHNSRRIQEVFGTTSRLTELLEAAHHYAQGAEKGDVDASAQSRLPVHIATVFGHEVPIDLDHLKEKREELLADIDTGKPRARGWLTKARALMTSMLADTQRPLNDITLWDVSSAVAAFFKAALAKMLLEGRWTEKANLKWRILRIALDGPAFYQHVGRLPDLLARKELIDHSLDAVRALLEEEIPIANEVYRDEFGSGFVVPDLDGEDNRGSLLKSLLEEAIRNAFREPLTGVRPERAEASREVKLEIMPALYVSGAHEKGLGLAHELAKTVPPVTATPETVRQWWQVGEPADVCTVCKVRPQGHPHGRTSRKAKQRRVCVPCESLRDDRCEDWLNNLHNTIWLDEVADTNGRVAVIVGRFGIDKWLEPGGYVETSLVVNPGPPLQLKGLTFARLRRIWDMTARFWEEIESKVLDALIPASDARWRITVQPGAESDDTPARAHAYQLEICHIGRVAVACADESGWKFITAENLARLAKVYKISPSELMERIQHKKCAVLEDKYNDEAGYTRATKIAEGAITEVERDPILHRPVIKILADPRSFMMLVPASHAADVLDAIKSKYETEMARVRNRLPIAVGMVFGEAHTPLSTMLDAGRRMMRQPVEEEKWTICRANHDRDHILEFADGAVWKIPRQMEDGVADEWYAYFLRAGSGQAVHASDLKERDEVRATPSRFDFQFLDCAATRFELQYSAGNNRRAPRPYLLEQSEELARVWEILRTGLATSQIKALQADISAKRRQWNGDGRAALETFVRDTIATADWKPDQKPSPEELALLTKAGTSGLLEDAAQLYMGLLKRKTEMEGDDE